MILMHLRKMPRAYEIESRDDWLVNVWLCRQIDTYICDDGIREFDIDVRVVQGVEFTSGLEDDIRMRFDALCERGTQG